MNRIIVIDSGPLGMISNPKATPENQAAGEWLEHHLSQNVIVALPGIADYEVRRELLLHGRKRGLSQLDSLKEVLDFIPFTREIMLLAARLWADARRRGQPTAELAALDGDVILAAQAILAPEICDTGPNVEVIVATTNPRHLSQFVNAKMWQKIT